MSFWKKIGKEAGKFQFVITFHELTLECEKGPWKPSKLAVSVYHRNRRFSSEMHDWEPTINNCFRGKVVWTRSESVAFVTTLFRDPGEKIYEPKERTIVLEEIESNGRRRPLASVSVYLNLYAKPEPSSSNDIENLKPRSKKVVEASLNLTFTSTLLKEGHATDEDMRSISTLLGSQHHNSDVGNLADFDDLSAMGTFKRKKSTREKISALTNSYKFFRSPTSGAGDAPSEPQPISKNLTNPPDTSGPTQNSPEAESAVPVFSQSFSDRPFRRVPSKENIPEQLHSNVEIEERKHQTQAGEPADYQERARILLDMFKPSTPASTVTDQIVSAPRLTPIPPKTSSAKFQFYQFRKLDETVVPPEVTVVEQKPSPTTTHLVPSSDVVLEKNRFVDDRKVESNIRSLEDIQEERFQLEKEQRVIDDRAVDVKARLKDSVEPGSEESDENILLEWLALVNKRNAIVRRLEQLKILEKQSDLESRHERILLELDRIHSYTDGQQTDSNRKREQMLMEDLMEIVKKRNELVLELDAQEKAIEEDNDVAQSALQQISDSRNDHKILHMMSAWSKKFSIF